ncbi:MAG: hypothetical protein ACLFSE_03205 [Spirochaetia bacterium]
MKKVLAFSLILLIFGVISAGAIGMNFSLFIPRHGYLSVPVSPVSLRDIGISFGKYFGIATAISLDSIAGMAIKDSSGNLLGEGPMAGPFLSSNGSIYAKINIPIKSIEITARGGVFGFYNSNFRLLTGNIDRYIASRDGYNSVTSDFESEGKFGWGYVFGGSLTYWFGPIGISAGANYYLGKAALSLTGQYYHDGTLESAPPAYLQNVYLDYSGLEIIIGGSYKL